RSALLPDNSLERYVKPAAMLSLDEDALRQEVAAPAQRHHLAALKHEKDITSIKELDWPAVLCSRERFVEVIFVGDVQPNAVAELRIKRDELLRLSDMPFDDMMGVLDGSDRAELDDFTRCMDELEVSGLAPKLREV